MFPPALQVLKMGRRARQDLFAGEKLSTKNSPSASLGEVGALSEGLICCPAVVSNGELLISSEIPSCMVCFALEFCP